MNPQPGQGFLLGSKIKIRAIPYPLPASAATDLIAAGQRLRKARRVVENIKEGSTPQKDMAVDEYDHAVSSLNSIEDQIRRAIGVEYIREEILPLKGFKK